MEEKCSECKGKKRSLLISNKLYNEVGTNKKLCGICIVEGIHLN